MKRKEKKRSNSSTQAPQNSPDPGPGKGFIVRKLVLGTLLLLMGSGTWAFFEFVVWNKLPGELVGAWEVVHGPPEYKEAVFKFYRSGKMVGHLNDNGNLRIMNAEVRVDGNKIFITTRRPSTGEEKTIVQHVRTLTANRLVVEDEQGQRLSMERTH